MIRTIYIIILIYFLLGGIGFYMINRKKEPKVARKSYTKFITYFFIINSLFFSIIINPTIFRYLSVLIIGAGFLELFKLFRETGFQHKSFFLASVIVFAFLSIGFYFFSGLAQGLILFSFLVLSIFDSFSQITGQLWGRKKIAPEISPKKTYGGLIGGALVALASSFWLDKLYAENIAQSLLLAAGIIVFAFTGDIAASFYKRKYKQKDFSNLIPGHGGFLDRFDSLLAGGAWIAVCMYLLKF
ncbi:phosphatidate cytidylyltransferase [Sunxiuqinia sp. sy24]|uniref:phosphatidate cytidylyltransferase n=1 Tax=Sunxiuqinia sp. sy24 TaxID=3461495 RepID=UPI004045D592